MSNRKSSYVAILLTFILVGITGLVFFSKFDLSVANIQPNIAQAEDILPPIKIILFAPASDSPIDTRVMEQIDPSLLLVTDKSMLDEVAALQKPNAIVFDTNALDLIDDSWLQELYGQGIILGVLNGKEGQLSVKLGLMSPRDITSQSAFSFVPQPYISYAYDQSDASLGLELWGRGIIELRETGDFYRDVQNVEEARIYNIDANNLNEK